MEGKKRVQAKYPGLGLKLYFCYKFKRQRLEILCARARMPVHSIHAVNEMNVGLSLE